MKRAALFVVFVLVAASGCSDDGEISSPNADVVLRVVDGNTVARDWTLAELEAEVSFTEIVVEGDAQTGPLLVDVIAASGVDGWETGEVLGMSEGRVVAVALDIASSDVDNTWVFDVTNRGTLKLASPNLQRQQWVRDVGEIRFP